MTGMMYRLHDLKHTLLLEREARLNKERKDLENDCVWEGDTFNTPDAQYNAKYANQDVKIRRSELEGPVYEDVIKSKTVNWWKEATCEVCHHSYPYVWFVVESGALLSKGNRFHGNTWCQACLMSILWAERVSDAIQIANTGLKTRAIIQWLFTVRGRLATLKQHMLSINELSYRKLILEEAKKQNDDTCLRTVIVIAKSME